MALPDFELLTGKVSDSFREHGISTFNQACEFIQNLPYARISDRDNLDLVVLENRGTCSSKHGILSRLCEENGHEEIELITGIFLMSPKRMLNSLIFSRINPTAIYLKCIATFA